MVSNLVSSVTAPSVTPPAWAMGGHAGVYTYAVTHMGVFSEQRDVAIYTLADVCALSLLI